VGILAALCLGGLLSTAANANADHNFSGRASSDTVKVGAEDPFHLSGQPVADQTDGPATQWYERIPVELCLNTHMTDAALIDQCPPPEDLNAACPDGARTLDPLYLHTRTIAADGTPGPWGRATYQPGANRCLNPADLADAARRAFRTLKITPSPLHVQPGTAQVLVNIPTITYTDPDPQTFDITLLGVPVQVRATPTQYTWAYGDGTAPLVTTDPGRPFPDQTVAHTYDHAAPATIDLTTTWQGTFRIQGTTADPADPAAWTPIDGDVTTTSPTHPLTVVERNAHLVADDG
jgi:hypothetical protein